jgi:hypothetical protein
MGKETDQFPPFFPQIVQMMNALMETHFVIFLVNSIRNEMDKLVFPRHGILLRQAAEDQNSAV